MTHSTQPSARARRLWRLTEGQHGVVSHAQLLGLGYTSDAIRHRVRRGRLHRKARGVFAVGRPELSRHGEMMVAVLACAPGAVVSHETAAELWGLRRPVRGPLHVSVPRRSPRARTGVVAHRRSVLGAEHVTRRRDVPVTGVALTLVDLAAGVSTRHLEAAVNMADSLDLLNPEELRGLLEAYPRVRGVARLRRLLDESTFRLTDSELERMFRRLVATVNLSQPLTQRHRDGFRVDFVWPELGLVVETDSLRYHRTALQQRRDAARDHAHLFGDVESVRFTHFQIAYQQAHVRRALLKAARKAALLRGLRDELSALEHP